MSDIGSKHILINDILNQFGFYEIPETKVEWMYGRPIGKFFLIIVPSVPPYKATDWTFQVIRVKEEIPIPALDEGDDVLYQYVGPLGRCLAGTVRRSARGGSAIGPWATVVHLVTHFLN